MNHFSGHIKRALASVGLPSIPYALMDEPTFPDIAAVLAEVMRSLDINIFFMVDFPSAKSIIVSAIPLTIHE